ncbi:hypothetical protein GF402_04820 [Candidatus Fermentibacteria bacterium]|nr:hypothetical protein [Candidatus Fermentibacteria bacterium]
MLKRGFTPIEPVVAVEVLALLALIAVPRIAGQTEEAATFSCQRNMIALATAESMYFAEYDCYKAHMPDLAVMLDNAPDLRCPEDAGVGQYNLAGTASDVYEIRCPWDATEHGSIDDGVVGWD